MLFIGPSGYWLGAGLFLLANVCFGASIVFYNSYLPSIASEDQRDHVSAVGFAQGYAGGGLLLLLNLVLFLFGGKLGLNNAGVARISLASAGVWWLGFSFFTFSRLRARHAVRPLPASESYLTIGFRQLATLLNARIGVVTILMLLPLLVPVLILLQLPVQLALLPAAGPILVPGPAQVSR